MDVQKNKIILADCMDIMKDMPDNYIDLAIVDPPYGIGVNKMNMGGRKTIPPSNKKWDDNVPGELYFNELFRISKNQIIWGGNYFNLRPSRCFVIWDKGEMMYGRSFAECELAWVSFDKSARMYKKNPTQLDRIHPTQKPIQLYRWLLQNYAKPGYIILDTHSGSGSLACACHLEKFDFIAIEKDPDYYRDSVNRLDELRSQGTLF